MNKPNGKPDSAPEPQSVLVAEDDVLLRLALADDLMAAGFHVIQAASADDALSVLVSSVPVDLLVTDVRMPGRLDGLGLAARVRSEWPLVRIIVVSGDLAGAPSARSADAFFAKPYSSDAVIDCARQLLGLVHDGS